MLYKGKIGQLSEAMLKLIPPTVFDSSTGVQRVTLERGPIIMQTPWHVDKNGASQWQKSPTLLLDLVDGGSANGYGSDDPMVNPKVSTQLNARPRCIVSDAATTLLGEELTSTMSEEGCQYEDLGEDDVDLAIEEETNETPFRAGRFSPEELDDINQMYRDLLKMAEAFGKRHN